MIQRLQHAHVVLWQSDRQYKRTWYIAPQLLAAVIAGWILTGNAPNMAESPDSGAGSSSAWAKPAPQDELERNAASLQTQAANNPQSFTRLKAEADAGDPNVQLSVAMLYDPDVGSSRVVAPDIKTALHYYREAAEQGNVEAASRLGNIMAFGKGVPRNMKDALPWILKAANAGIPLAERNLGIIYRDGAPGIAADRAVSLQWFQRAAEADDHLAQQEIGIAHWNGTPPYAKDPAQAVQWCLKAAVEPAQTLAARILGIAYRDGIGISPDKAESVKRFLQAAQWGDTPSAVAVGVAYRDGIGTAPDHAQARYWFEKAANHGDQTAVGLLRSLK